MKKIILLVKIILIFSSSLASVVDLNKSDKIRILKKEIKRGLLLSCPYDEYKNKSLIYWVNETASTSQTTSSTTKQNYLDLITSTLSDRLSVVLTRPFKEISCGYYYNHEYTRIKKWSLSYVEAGEVTFIGRINEKYLKLKQLNQSTFNMEYFQNIDFEPIITNLECETNFDWPFVKQRFIKLLSRNKNEKSLTVEITNSSSQSFEENGIKNEFVDLMRKLYEATDNNAYISLRCLINTHGILDKYEFESKTINIIRIFKQSISLFEILLTLGLAVLILTVIICFIIFLIFNLKQKNKK